MEYYLCEFEYGYTGQFYQVVSDGNVVGYVDLDNNQLTLEGAYGYRLVSGEPVMPYWI
jgi:hypothetical protein